jgi:hypothetical protein
VPGPEPESRLPGALRNGAHLAVLSALALAQPLFDILGKNAAFFAVRGSTSTEIVLFALGLILVPPLALVVIELGAAALSKTLAQALHLFFVGALVVLLALSVLTSSDAVQGGAALAVAVVAGGAAALAYRQLQAARSFLTVLVPVPFVFLGLFLLDSPVSKLVFADTPNVQAATVQARTPVVLIVFDELSTASLMDRSQRVDAGRYPNFAALARESTWFRSATTKYWLSEVAVPSILTGRLPAPGRLPVLSEYPRNLFTLLGGSYRVKAIETLTRLCPPATCRETRSAQTRAVPGAAGSLASDVGIVYLHLLLPDPYADRLPQIDDSWGDFGDDDESEEPVRRSESGEIEACGRNICQFTELVSDDRRPTFYFLHSLLPHVPYVYLDSGRRYAIDARVLRGLDNGLWLDAWPALQSQQRYLLQLGYTDRALGLVLRRLRAAGVYDRAVVIVTADHGVSFRPRDQRRLPTASNLDDIAFVPLFVKLPGQKRGRVVDSLASTTDVVPTIARVLRLSLPWRVDGRALVGRRQPADGTVTVFKQDGSRVEAQLSELRVRRARGLARRVAALGTGSFARVYRVGPHRELLGRRVAQLRVRPSATARVEIDGRSLLSAVDPDSGFLPSYLEGRLTGRLPRRLELAVSVNGMIAAVTRTFRQHGQTRFAALVPERALRPGANDVAVFAVRGPVLEELPSSDLGFALRDGAIESTAGRETRIEPGALTGTVRATAQGTSVLFSGSATHRATRRPADSLVVFVDGRAVYFGRAENLKPHRILGGPALGKNGFALELPQALLPSPGGEQRVRVFAVRGAVASELRYLRGYPWGED